MPPRLAAAPRQAFVRTGRNAALILTGQRDGAAGSALARGPQSAVHVHDFLVHTPNLGRSFPWISTLLKNSFTSGDL